MVRSYHLNGVQVCKEVFLHTFGISNSVPNWILKKKLSLCGRPIAFDNRGFKTDLKLGNEHIGFIHQLGQLLPQYRSHFTTKQKTYWNSLLNWERIHKIYVDKLKDEKPAWKPVTKATFRHYFKQKYPNVSCYVPRKDRCSFCTSYGDRKQLPLSANERAILEAEHSVHLQRNEKFRLKIKQWAHEAQRDPEGTTCFCWDMMHCIPIPLTQVRKLI